jgi:hypothetical protein
MAITPGERALLTRNSIKRVRRFRAILIAFLVVGPTGAPRAAMVGIGNNDCGTWTFNDPAKGGVGLLYQQWVFGFLSGASRADPDHDSLKGVDAPAIMQWMGDYCQHNPNVPLADAAAAFVQAHRPP